MKMQKFVILVKKNSKINISKIKNIVKIGDHCHCKGEYRDAVHSICNLKYSLPKKVPTVFHNGSSYDYHFIIKELVKELKKQFTCLGENTKKYINFTVPIEKLRELINMEKKLKKYMGHITIY